MSKYFEGEHFDSYRAVQTAKFQDTLRVSILTRIKLYRHRVSGYFDSCPNILRVSNLTCIELHRCQVLGYFEGEHFDSYPAPQTPSVEIL